MNKLAAVIGTLIATALLAVSACSSDSVLVVSYDPRDLEPGMTLHTIEEKYRRYGPAADIYAEHFPENGPETKITEAWMVFDEDGNLSSLVSETRSEDGELLASAEMDGVDMVYRDADGVETDRLAGMLENATLSSFRERLLSAYDLMQEEVDEHPDAPLVTLDGTEFLLIEDRSPYSGRLTGPASPMSFSAPYLYDLQPVERISRQYISQPIRRYRSEDWVADADGVETLIEYSNGVLEVLEN